jgi:serine protease Do
MKRIGWIAGLSFLAGAVFFALSFGYLQKTDTKGTVLAPTVANADSVKVSGLNFAPLVKKVRPAVVKVLSESIVERGSSALRDDFFDRFFNVPRRRERVSGVGSGFLISADGYIITNNHVVKNAIKVRIDTIDKEEFLAKIVGTDPKTDLALLKIDGKNLPYIELGDSESVEVGEWVLAIGNPFYQDLSVTAGIISAKGRQLGAAEYEDFLQTDAAINQGNSGGPLVNLSGKVIGINSAIIAPTGGNVGIGFAIPSNMARKVISDLKREGRVIRGYLGVRISEISEKDAEDFDLPHGGVLIQKVEEDSPASRAGLKVYDLIVRIDGEKVESLNSLRTKIANLTPGDVIRLTVNRSNKMVDVEVKVTEAPDTERFRPDGEDRRSMDLGMVLQKNDSRVAREWELRTSQGLLVKKVERGGVAHQNRLRDGDVILAVNRTEVDSVAQFPDLLFSSTSTATAMSFS